MDIDKILQSLVENKFMPDFDYCEFVFSFRTLFYSTAFTYKICSCGYEHEYMRYISTSGKIDRNVYDKIRNCISTGACPHIQDEQQDHVRVTKIFAIHIAAAVGTQHAIINADTNSLMGARTGLFRVHPCGMAIMKHQCDILGHLLRTYVLAQEQEQHILQAQRLSEDSPLIRFDNVHLLELCIRQDSEMLLRRFLSVWSEPRILSKALEYAIGNALTPVVKILLEHIKVLVQNGNGNLLRFCADVAIVFDKPNMLDEIFNWSPMTVTSETLRHLHCLCVKLVRRDCLETLRVLLHLEEDDDTSEDLSFQLFVLLAYSYDNYASLQEAVCSIVQKKTRSSKSVYISTCKYLDTSDFEPFSPKRTHSVKLFFEAEKDILLATHLTRDRALRTLLAIPPTVYVKFYKQCRQNLEVVMSSNPDLEDILDKPIYFKPPMFTLLRATHIDLELRDNATFEYCRPNDYSMDGKCHSHSGHTEYAFHFILPLLIECGVRFNRDELVHATEFDLHPKEIEYLHNCIDEPRSLSKQCRDFMRRLYSGPKIYSFLAAQVIPTPVKKFILLHDMLQIDFLSVPF